MHWCCIVLKLNFILLNINTKLNGGIYKGFQVKFVFQYLFEYLDTQTKVFTHTQNTCENRIDWSKKKTIKTEQRVGSVKHNCTTVRLQDRHLHILTKYLLGRFYDSKKHRNTSSSSSRWRKREHWWDGVYGLSLHSVSEKVDVGINNLRLGASFYSKVIATLAVTVTVKITVTSNHIA